MIGLLLHSAKPSILSNERGDPIRMKNQLHTAQNRNPNLNRIYSELFTCWFSVVAVHWKRLLYVWKCQCPGCTMSQLYKPLWGVDPGIVIFSKAPPDDSSMQPGMRVIIASLTSRMPAWHHCLLSLSMEKSKNNFVFKIIQVSPGIIINMG